MAENIIIVFSVLMVSLTFTNLVVSDDATVSQNGSIGDLSCADKEGVGNGTNASNCTNGRGLFGCCVDRTHCDFNTTNIDLTLYAPPGFKASCPTTSVCCPIDYIAEVNNKVNIVKNNDYNDDEDAI